MTVHTDTDGLLDLCHCGAAAGFEWYQTESVRVMCTECCEQTFWFETADAAGMDWNLARRTEKGLTCPIAGDAERVSAAGKDTR